MPRRPSRDPNKAAFDLVRRVIASGGKNPFAVALGQLGGAKGGKARAAKLSPERRSEIARNAALARHAKERRAKKPS